MKREKLFIDTGGWIALIDAGDTFHLSAKSFYLSIDPSVKRMTSSHVIGETFTWLRYKTGFSVASLFLSVVRQAKLNERLTIVYDGNDLLEQTEQLLADFPDQKLSYVDALSMAIMRREGISKVFGFDHHFNYMKFAAVPHVK